MVKLKTDKDYSIAVLHLKVAMGAFIIEQKLNLNCKLETSLFAS